MFLALEALAVTYVFAYSANWVDPLPKWNR